MLIHQFRKLISDGIQYFKLKFRIHKCVFKNLRLNLRFNSSSMKHLILLFVALVILSCSSPKTLPNKTVDDHTKNGLGSTGEFLEGKKLYEANCGTCHRLYKPNSQSVEGWKHEVPEMSIKVNRRAENMLLDEKKQEIILNYLLTASDQK